MLSFSEITDAMFILLTWQLTQKNSNWLAVRKQVVSLLANSLNAYQNGAVK